MLCFSLNPCRIYFSSFFIPSATTGIQSRITDTGHPRRKPGTGLAASRRGVALVGFGGKGVAPYHLLTAQLLRHLSRHMETAGSVLCLRLLGSSLQQISTIVNKGEKGEKNLLQTVCSRILLISAKTNHKVLWDLH